MPGSHRECAEQRFPGRDEQLEFRERQEKVQGSRTWRRVCCCMLSLHPHLLLYRKKNILHLLEACEFSCVLLAVVIPIASLSCLFVTLKQDEAQGRKGCELPAVVARSAGSRARRGGHTGALSPAEGELLCGKRIGAVRALLSAVPE